MFRDMPLYRILRYLGLTHATCILCGARDKRGDVILHLRSGHYCGDCTDPRACLEKLYAMPCMALGGVYLGNWSGK